MILSISSGIDSFVQFITVLILFIFVLVITYITTRCIANVEKNKIKTGNIELLEAVRLSGSKYIQIVKVGDKFFCVAICKDNVTLLGEIDGQELVLKDDNAFSEMKFREVFEKIKKKALQKPKAVHSMLKI